MVGIAAFFRTGLPFLAGLAASAAAAAPSGARDVTVVDRAPQAMNEIYVSPHSSDQWGEDRLGNRVLPAGSTFRVRLGRAAECAFDIKVIYQDASSEERRGIDICRGPRVVFDGSTASAAPENGSEHQVTLADRSTRAIQQVFISPPEASQWGEDRLPNGSISVGQRRAITWRGECVVDLRVVFENRAAEERRGVDLCATPAVSIEPGWTTADALPPAKPEAVATLTIANGSGALLSEFYLEPADQAGPGNDLLGAAQLPAGAERQVRFDRDGNCRFTARAVFDGGTPERVMTGLDLCAEARIEVPPP